MMTTGEAGDAIVIDGKRIGRYRLLYYLRQGAPEPGRIGIQRAFTDEDLEAVREWIIERRKKA